MQALEAIEHGVQIGLPDITAIDHADRQHLGGRQPVDHLGKLVAAAHAVHMHAGHRQLQRHQQVLAQRPEIAGEQELDARAVEGVIGAFESRPPLGGQVERKGRLVDLHPLDPLRLQARQNLRIDRQQPVEQVEAIEVRRLFLAQPQEGQRADQHRLGGEPGRLRLGHLVEQPSGIEREMRVRFELGDQIVIVGIEPFGHLHRMARGIAARQLEIFR